MAGSGRGYGKGSFWGDHIGPNPTDRAKMGVKRSVLVEADGGPLSVVVAGANVPDFKLLEDTIEAIVVERPDPTEQAPQHLCLDAGYDKELAREVVDATATPLTSGPSEKRRRTRRARSVTRRGDGWSNVRWAGSRSAGPSWCARTRRPLTTWG